MDSISHRLSLAENRVKSLQQYAKDLKTEIAEIKRLSTPAEEEEPARPHARLIATPPPLPEYVPLRTETAVEKEPLEPMPETRWEPEKPAPERPTRPDRAALEMQLGRVWSVRLGIVLLTTGFVFLSGYTYDNFVRDLGPGFRLAMLYLFSFVLAGAGLFFEKWKESLKTYGRVVAAGGFSAIYYCSFAAHNVEALRVIESPVIASILLTASAGLFCVVSLRRESRTMFATSLGLAFYSVSVNPIGWMACLSALVLATLGVVMMARYRWTEVGFLVLLGSYGSFVWWQLAVASGGDAARWFLPAYWLLFVAASLFATKSLEERQHWNFTTINHTAFFLLFSFDLKTHRFLEQQWLFSLFLGIALLALGILARDRFPRKTAILHVAKGIGLITLGISLKLSGYQLFISLLIEALILMVVYSKFPRQETRAASWLISALSLLALSKVVPSEIHPAAWLIGTLGWLAMGILDRRFSPGAIANRIHPQGMIGTIIAAVFLISGFMGDWPQTTSIQAVTALGLISSALFLLPRLKTIAFDVLWGFCGIALLTPLFLVDLTRESHVYFIMAILTLGHSLMQSHLASRTDDSVEHPTHHGFSFALMISSIALLVGAIVFAPLEPGTKMILLVSLPLAGTLIASKTKNVLHSAVPFFAYLVIPQIIDWEASILFFCFFISLANLLFVKFRSTLPDKDFLAPALFLITSFFWGTSIARGIDQPAILLSWTAVGILFLRPWFGVALVSLSATPFYLVGIGLAFLTRESSHLYLSLAAPLGLHLWSCHRERKDVRYPLMTIVSLLALWIMITLDLGRNNPAAVWAVTGTAFLLIGLFLKSRCFRLMGLIVLTVSLGHLMLIDLIQLEPLARILSFMTLGFGLLGLGYVYNRYQDRLKQIL